MFTVLYDFYFNRLMKRGYLLSATITLPCRRYEDKKSRNIVYEIQGSIDEVVLIGGHTDSWECHHLSCQGAHDDGQVPFNRRSYPKINARSRK